VGEAAPRINVESGNVYMYADDTTLYCIGDSADEAKWYRHLTKP
jgi:hypothetical protein